MVQIVVAGGYDVFTPPAFDPFVGIDFPARVIEHGVDGHEHQHEERHADMERDDERHDGEEPGRAGGLYRDRKKSSPKASAGRCGDDLHASI